tara:strand:- start:42 stop:773 length:732 start_codon:yes stop_codon:yes gene_type:complete
MKFGYLSTLDNPLLPEFIKYALLYNINNIYVIIDTFGIKRKDHDIFKNRTDGKFGDSHDLNQFLKKLNDINLPFYFVENHNSNKANILYNDLDLDCLLNAGTPRKISDMILKSIKKGVVNIHPGILPDYRGCSCVEWAILNDDPVGNTAHFMDSGYDTGPIIFSENYSFPKNSKYIDIRSTIYIKGCQLAARVLKGIENNEIVKENCNVQSNSEGRYWEPIPSDLENNAISKANLGKYRFQTI